MNIFVRIYDSVKLNWGIKASIKRQYVWLMTSKIYGWLVEDMLSAFLGFLSSVSFVRNVINLIKFIFLNTTRARLAILSVGIMLLILVFSELTERSLLAGLYIGLFLGLVLVLLLRIYYLGFYLVRLRFLDRGAVCEVRDYLLMSNYKKSCRELFFPECDKVNSKIYLRKCGNWAYFDDLRQHIWKTGVKDFTQGLLLGGGGGAVAYTMIDDFPGVKFDMVEISEDVIGVAKNFFLHKKPYIYRAKYYHQDAIEYLKLNNKKYDFVFLDIIVYGVLPKQFTSLRFIRNLKSTMMKNSILVVNFGWSHQSKIDEITSNYLKVFDDFHLYLMGSVIAGVYRK